MRDDESGAAVRESIDRLLDGLLRGGVEGAGRLIKEEHREKGGDCAVDISYQWLTFFLHDDAKLQHIHDEYSSGRMLSGEIKKELIDVITPMVLQHQKARALVTDDQVRTFMTPRKLNLSR